MVTRKIPPSSAQVGGILHPASQSPSDEQLDSEPQRIASYRQREIARERLSVSDEALWQSVALTIAPLQEPHVSHSRVTKRKAQLTKHANMEKGERDISKPVRRRKPTRDDFANLLDGRDDDLSTSPQRHTFDDKARDHVIDNSSQPSVRQPKRVASRLALESFDPRLKKKIVRGHAPLEARLDLHGLTQDEAFATLSHFIKSAHGRGLRHVLVITGKGQRTKGLNPSSEKSSGVLKRQVPQWLALPALSPFVLMVDYASPLHGGEGALYVRLRASRQSITSDGENVL